MKTATKITAGEATKMYDESQNSMSEVIGKGKRLTFHHVISAGIITWGMLFMLNATAYAVGPEQSAWNLSTKEYIVKPKATKSKTLQQFPKDVLNLATAWREIPKTVYHVGQDEGTVVGLVVGPIKGATSMAKNISKGLLQSLNSDKNQNDSKSLVFSYKF